MRNARRALLPGLALLLLSACASGGRAPEGGDRNVITLEELSQGHHQDAFSLVQALRPNWLLARGATSVNQREEVKVYLDGLLLGGVGSLRQIPVRSIASLRYYNGIDASQRWGLDHGMGAIEVFTRTEG